MKNTIRRSFAIMIAALMLMACGLARAESYAANTMRLLNFEGDVQIEDASGQPRFVMKNVRFDSGEALITGSASAATVSLDDTKLVSLDENTRVAFAKSGGALTLNLTDGAILLDVSKKLTDGESLDIQTSTMTVGIRGTIVFVRSEDAPEGGRMSTLGVLEGTAQLSYRDASGAARSMPVPAGQIAKVKADADGQVHNAPDLATVDTSGLPTFVKEQVSNNEALRQRVEDAIEQDYSANGKWIWNGTVTLVAQSASKLYDGSPLTRPGDVLVYGLPSGFSITVRASGSQTDAGTTANNVSSYSIRNSRGEDVTSHFNNVEKVSGQLVVDPAPLTVWTGSAEKVYDGTPLTCPETGMSSVPGYERNTTPWRNMSYVSGGGGVQTLYALSGSIWVHGTNPLTGETREIQLNAGQKMEVQLNDDGTAASIELKVENAKLEEIPDDVLRLYADNPELMSQACADAGWDVELLQMRVDRLRESDKATVEKDGLTVEHDVADRLMRDSTNVRITVDSDITSYNNRALGSDEAKFTPVHIDSGITVTATGSQTEVGESPNTCEIDWGGTNPGNYILSEELGTLTVLEPEAPPIEDEVTLTAASAEKVYDGAPLTDASMKAEGLPEGYSAEAAVEGSITDAGTAENKVTSYKILDADGNDATAQFTNVTVKSGTLTVEPLKLSVDLGGVDATYDGKPFTPTVTVTYLNGPHAGESAGTRAGSKRYAAGPEQTSTQTSAETAQVRSWTLFTGDAVQLTVSGGGTDVGTHTITASLSVTGGKSVNFDPVYTSIEYTIEPAPLTVTTGSASKAYDGKPLTSAEASITGLVEGETATVTATGTITDAGSTENTYTIDWGETKASNYTLTESLGTLEVTPFKLTIDLGGRTAEYNGGPQMPEGPKCESVPSEGIHVVTDGMERKVGTSNVFTLPGGQLAVTVLGFEDAGTHTLVPVEEFLSGKAANYDITYTNQTMTITPMKVTVKLHDGSALTYNGQEQLGKFSATSLRFDIGWTVDGQRGFTYGSDRAIVTVTGGGSDAGSYTLSGSVSMELGEASNYDVSFTGTSMVIDPAPLTVTTLSGSKVYDGTPLTKAGATLTGLVTGDTATASATGTITDAGTAENTYSIEWGETNAANYTITENLGTLTVSPLGVKFTMVCPDDAVFCKWGYYPETMSGAYAGGGAVTRISEDVTDSEDGLVDEFELKGGDKVRLTCNGVVDAGTYTITPSVEFLSGKAGNYSFSYEGNSLTVVPFDIHFVVVADEVDGDRWCFYDGQYHGGQISAYSTSGIEFSFDDKVSDTVWVAEAFGDTIRATLTGMGKDAGEYTMGCTYEVTSGKPSNYSLSQELTGTEKFKIVRRTATVTTGGATKEYDGKPLTNPAAGIEGLIAGESATVTATGSQTNVGKSKNTYSIVWGENTKAENYELDEDPHELIVGPNYTEIRIIADSASKPYDGTPLTKPTFTVTGLPEGFRVEATVEGEITNAGTAENVVSTFVILDSTGKEVTSYFSNAKAQDGTLEVERAQVAFGIPDTSKFYNGTKQFPDYSVVGLPEGFTATANTSPGGVDVDEYQCEVVDCKIFKGDEEVTSNFDIATEKGTLSITRIHGSLGVTGTYEYDGKVHYGTLTAKCDGNPTVFKMSDTQWTVKWPWGDSFNITLGNGSAEVGQHTISLYKESGAETNDDNYMVYAPDMDRVIKITPNTTPIVITAGSGSRAYNGKAFTVDTYSVDGAPAGFEVWAEAGGSQTIVGSSESKILGHGVRLGGDEVGSCFSNITLKTGTVTVTPKTLYIRTGSAIDYGVDVLTNDYVYVNGLVSGETATVVATGKQVGLGSSSNTYSISWGTTNSNNYAISAELGTLTITDDPEVMPSHDTGGPLPVIEAQQVEDPTVEPSESVEPEPTPAPEEPTLADLDEDEDEPEPETEAPAEPEPSDTDAAEPAKPEEPKADEPKAEEPKADEPKADEPKVEEPKAEEPKPEAPKAEEPKTEAPKQEEPKQEAPKQEEPKQEVPKQEAPKQEAPKQEEPKQEAPKQEAPKQEAPKQEAPKQEAPKQEAPKQEAPKQEAPKQEAPKQEAPKQEAPKQEAPKQEAPKQEAPKQEAPKQEAPKQEAPKQEAPKQEAPKVEAPKPEEPKAEEPKPEAPPEGA